MRIIDRYILSRLFLPFVLGVGIFSLISLLCFIFDAAELLFTKNLPLGMVFLGLLLYLPTTFIYTIPVGVLIANLIAWGRLRQRGEIIALKTSGVSLLPPVFLILMGSLILSGLLYLFTYTVLPSISSTLTGWFSSMSNTRKIQFAERTFIELDSHEVFIQKIERGRLYGVYIYEEGGLGEDKIILANSADYWVEPSSQGMVSIWFRLYDGTIQQVDPKDLDRYRLLRFKTQTISIETKMGIDLKRRIGEISSRELLERIRERRRLGLDAVPLLVEFHKRKAILFSCLCFALIGIPIGVGFGQRRAGVGFALSIPFILLYYLGLRAGEILSLKGLVSPLVGMWVVNLLFLTTGSLLLLRFLRQ
jgi:lipopolysaccharide export LptBFGC system permease protein LptF